MRDIIVMFSQTARKDMAGGIAAFVAGFLLVWAIVYGFGAFTAATADVTQWTSESRFIAGIISLIGGTLLGFVYVAVYNDLLNAAQSRCDERLQEYRELLNAKVPPRVGDSARERKLKIRR